MKGLTMKLKSFTDVINKLVSMVRKSVSRSVLTSEYFLCTPTGFSYFALI